MQPTHFTLRSWERENNASNSGLAHPSSKHQGTTHMAPTPLDPVNKQSSLYYPDCKNYENVKYLNFEIFTQSCLIFCTLVFLTSFKKVNMNGIYFPIVECFKIPQFNTSMIQQFNNSTSKACPLVLIWVTPDWFVNPSIAQLLSNSLCFASCRLCCVRMPQINIKYIYPGFISI